MYIQILEIQEQSKHVIINILVEMEISIQLVQMNFYKILKLNTYHIINIISISLRLRLLYDMPYFI